jgi:uncharacterized metal-binding protein YceD (DUF177 family)
LHTIFAFRNYAIKLNDFMGIFDEIINFRKLTMKKGNEEYRIYHKKLGLGKHKQDFQITNKFFDAFEFSEVKKGEIIAKADIEVRNSAVIVKLELSGTVNVQCDVCLEYFDMKISNNVLLTFKFTETPENSYFDDEIIYISDSAEFIDLQKILYDYIILALPIKKVHPVDKNGNRTCNPEILKKLDKLSSDETKTNVKNSEIWDELKKLLN